MLENDFILSKTGFIAYLECPFQFYLQKELQHHKGSGGNIDHSGYESFLQRGLEKHKWLECFYQEYGTKIRNDVYPRLDQSDEDAFWKQQFIDFEIKRYVSEPKFWEPVAVEYYLNDGVFCGKIDRIDRISDLGHCRIVEYKSSPKEFDKEELLFYAVLLASQLPTLDLPDITKVTELGMYYYSSSEYFSTLITMDNIVTFREYLEEILLEIVNPQSIKKKKRCDFAVTTCLFRHICQRINIKNRK